MEIQWKSGSQHKVRADVAHTEIEKLRKKNHGDVSAEDLVKAAKAKKNALHPEFEWDDSLAGHEYRLEQGRRVLRSLVVVRSDIPTDRPQRRYETRRVPQTNSDKPERSHVYSSMEDIMANPDSRAELLGRALSDLIRIRNRYRDLQELSLVLRAIDSVLEEIQA